LLDKPEFNVKTTIGKIFKVIQALLESDDSCSVIANRYKLDETMVVLIKTYVTKMQGGESA
jgi:predicted transcriptional regulator